MQIWTNIETNYSVSLIELKEFTCINSCNIRKRSSKYYYIIRNYKFSVTQLSSFIIWTCY